MINLEEIEEEISRLEDQRLTYEVCQKLAMLYTIRAEHKKTISDIAGSYTAGVSSSEFICTADGAPLCELMKVIDEHMECIKALYPKEYTALLNRISMLK